MKKLNLILLLATGVVFFLIYQRPGNDLRLIFCDVGQGDAILMSYQHYQVLVDGGPDLAVLSCLGDNLPFWDRKIEAVILTHPQADHLTGLVEVIRRYQVEKVFMSRAISQTAEFKQLKTEISQRKIKTSELIGGDRLRFEAIELTVMWPQGHQEEKELSETNKIVTVLKGKFNSFEWLLTGDLMESEERLLVDKLSPVAVLKVAHHGSKYSSSANFLEKVKPQLAVISVGKNSFGHPTRETLDRLGQAGAKILRTDKNGQIAIVSNGRSWYIKSDDH